MLFLCSFGELPVFPGVPVQERGGGFRHGPAKAQGHEVLCVEGNVMLTGNSRRGGGGGSGVGAIAAAGSGKSNPQQRRDDTYADSI